VFRWGISSVGTTGQIDRSAAPELRVHGVSNTEYCRYAEITPTGTAIRTPTLADGLPSGAT
jgi:hypothetical protein